MCVFEKGINNIKEIRSVIRSRQGSMAQHSSHSSSHHGRSGSVQLDFGVTLDDLKHLMQLRTAAELKTALDRDFGGIEALARKLNSDLQHGISSDSKEDIKKRQERFGKNEIPPKPPKPFWRLMFEAVQDTTLIMLIICAVISIALSFYNPPDTQHQDITIQNNDPNHESNLEWVEGCAIMIAVFVVVFVTAFNDWRKERQFRGLKAQIDQNHMASVIRNGHHEQIPVSELLVGDICCVKYGDLIPADGLVTQASDLKLDEASMTGETDLIRKNESENLLLMSGTHVMEGTGKFMVTAVGLNSQTGILMTLLGATNAPPPSAEDTAALRSKAAGAAAAAAGTDEESIMVENKDTSNNSEASKSKKKRVAPESAGTSSTESKKDKKAAKKQKRASNKKHRSVLQIKLNKLALKIGYGGMVAAGFTFVILVLRMCITEFAVNHNEWSNTYIKYFIYFLIQAITVIVVAVPEGLPLAVTLALAFAVRKMTKDNNLVRHLDACETMGNATTICSDKTGTLTTNRMTVVESWIGEKHFKQKPESNEISGETRKLLYNSISINSNYTSTVEPTTKKGEKARQIGNKTECGLLEFVNELGGNYKEIRQAHPADHFVKVFTFNSARKMMATVISLEGGAYRLFAKGASEIVLGKCTHYLNAQGKPAPMSQDKLEEIVHSVIDPMASNGLRTICIAYRDFDSKADDWEDESAIISKLTCIGIMGIEDPVRDEVPEAIAKCQRSGVVVRMVTGDNINTATSIALKCGIIKPSDDFLVLDSAEFNKRIRDKDGQVSQALFDKVWPRLRVLARSSPHDKFILVNGIVESRLNANREVVAVTGDGTNDGPALKRADVGFSMGIQGTDVAKEASDIILTDDNFNSIVKALMWGRNVYDAIAKFLQFQLTANFSAGIFSVVCAATIQAVPLKAVQMLWINLVMDTLASLALATEPPTEDLLNRKPYGRTKSIISTTMMKNIIGQAFYQLIICFLLVWLIEPWMLVESVVKTNDINKLRDPSVHFTIIFNAFVLMTLFNEINARKIRNERNIFEGLQRNLIFIVIWVVCFVGQIIIINVGGVVFSVERLEWDQWLWCFAFGIGSLLWGQVLSAIPDSYVKKLFGLIKRCCCCCKKKAAAKGRRESTKKAPSEKGDESDFFDEDETAAEKTLDEDEDELGSDERIKALWIRGANRVHSQLQVVYAFKTKLDEVKDTYNIYGSMMSLKDFGQAQKKQIMPRRHSFIEDKSKQQQKQRQEEGSTSSGDKNPMPAINT